MAVIATTGSDTVSEDTVVSQFDELADSVDASTPDHLTAAVFGVLGFRGNTERYYDPRNSLIDRVLDRRVGIPLSLSVVVVEIGRRCGIEFSAIGMPGHVLLQSSEGWHDPFAAGAAIDRAGCERIFAAIHPDVPFHDRYLAPMSTTAIAARTLENLRLAHTRRGDLSSLASVLALRADIPGAPVDHRMEYARVLERTGRHDLAAEQRDLLAELLPLRSEHQTSEAARLRAHNN